MPGERWPDKRARAVLVAGANKLARDGAELDPEAIGALGLRVRETLFVDPEVREETQDAKAHTIGYNLHCMQYALLAPDKDGIALSLWVGQDAANEACDVLRAEPDSNPFRRMYGWVRCVVKDQNDAEAVTPWVARSVEHAAQVKAAQAPSGMA